MGASALNLKNPSDLYASLFFSRTVQDDIINRFNLGQHYKVSDRDDLRTLIAKRTHADVGKDGIITLSYTDIGRDTSAEIANGMIDAMYRIAKKLAKEESIRRLEFYDNLIEDAKNNVIHDLAKLLEAEQQTGLTRLKDQETMSASAIVELKGMIASREIMLSKMLLTATRYHPEIVRASAELNALKSQLNQIDYPKYKAPQINESKNLLLSFQTYPELLSKVQPLRTIVDIDNKVLEDLIKARTLSTIDDSRDSSVISILDQAVAPTKKSGPRVFLNAIFGVIISFLLVIILLVVWDYLFTDQARRERWKLIFKAYDIRIKNISR